jgi:hypothetical protein
MPGEYRATVLGMPVDYFVKEARIEQTDVLNDIWVITGPVRGTLNIVVSSGAGQIDGTVIDSRLQGVPALQDNTHSGSKSRPHRSDQNCSHGPERQVHAERSCTRKLQNLCVGSYRAQCIFRSSDSCGNMKDQGKAVLVTEGGKILADVKMIPSK